MDVQYLKNHQCAVPYQGRCQTLNRGTREHHGTWKEKNKEMTYKDSETNFVHQDAKVMH
jgi:hypothetical protein